jgi:hypothetical protein
VVVTVGLTVSEPLTGRVPVHPLLAVQLVVLVVLQFSVLLWPVMIVAGAAEKLSVGAGGGLTVTLADWLIVPPAPAQVRT